MNCVAQRIALMNITEISVVTNYEICNGFLSVSLYVVGQPINPINVIMTVARQVFLRRPKQ